MTPLQKAVINAYRRTVADRYSLEYLRNNPDTAGISDEHIEAMREFFLEHVYPPPAERENLEAALQALGDVLKSPRKLWLLLGASPFRKLGGMLPTALRAGLRTFDAFLKIRKLERRLDELARKRNLSVADVEDPEKFLDLIREMPRREIETFRADGIALLQILADGKLLNVTLDILGDSRKIMDDRSDVFTPREREGVATGFHILDGAHRLFQALPTEQVPVIVAGIDSIEATWYQLVLDRAI